MRRTGLVLAALVLSGLAPWSAVHAQQQPPTPPPATEADKKLDGYLQQWEAKMKEIAALHAALERTETDKTFNTVTKLSGIAEYLKRGTGATAESKARLEMTVVGKKEFREKIIFTGLALYQYSPTEQKIYVTEIPKAKPGESNQDSFLTLVFGGPSADLKARYDLRLSDDKAHPNGEDKYYIYVDVFPKQAGDKADFQRAQLVLNKDNLLPRRLWFEAPNKSETLWDITSINDKAKLDLRDFDAPTPPKDWKLEKQESDKPRLMRGGEK